MVSLSLSLSLTHPHTHTHPLTHTHSYLCKCMLSPLRASLCCCTEPFSSFHVLPATLFVLVLPLYIYSLCFNLPLSCVLPQFLIFPILIIFQFNITILFVDQYSLYSSLFFVDSLLLGTYISHLRVHVSISNVYTFPSPSPLCLHLLCSFPPFLLACFIWPESFIKRRGWRRWHEHSIKVAKQYCINKRR